MARRIWIDLEYGDYSVASIEQRMPSLLEIGCAVTGEGSCDFSMLVKPLYPQDVTGRISGITARSLDDYAKGESPYEALRTLNLFLKRNSPAELFAWGCRDESMLRWWFDVYKITPAVDLRIIDCWSYLKALVPDMPKRLRSACRKYGLTTPPHAALADCLAMANLFYAVTEENESDDGSDWHLQEF
jgi:DNA polymerase III epsilon subunit-like protein